MEYWYNYITEGFEHWILLERSDFENLLTENANSFSLRLDLKLHVVTWLNDDIGKACWDFSNGRLMFAQKEDAFAFKMTWG